MAALTRDQEWTTFGMAVYAAIHRRSGLATVQVTMDEPRMTVDTAYSPFDMGDVRDPMLAHDIGQLDQRMAMIVRARLITLRVCTRSSPRSAPLLPIGAIWQPMQSLCWGALAIGACPVTASVLTFTW